MNEERIYIAACGICCSVCGLYLEGIYLPYGSGRKVDEEVVRKKMEEQTKNVGHVCSRLQCVLEKEIGYCMRNCPEFPCKIYKERLFPYSEEFLKMFNIRNSNQNRSRLSSVLTETFSPASPQNYLTAF